MQPCAVLEDINNNFCLSRRNGRVGFSFGGSGGGGSTKVVLTLDDLVFINTQISKRVSSLLNLSQSSLVSVLHTELCTRVVKYNLL